MLTLTHTHLDGTLLEGTSRGDGSAAALKPLGWRWSRNLEAWYVPRSRDTDGQQWRIKATVEALEAADFEVTVDVDNTPRATADVHADKIARASARADALERKAARLESKIRCPLCRRESDHGKYSVRSADYRGTPLGSSGTP